MQPICSSAASSNVITIALLSKELLDQHMKTKAIITMSM